MNATEVRATCCKCGAGLKYPVTIGNKVYGSTCASKHLGIHDIPDQWSGNYDDLKKQRSIEAEEMEAENKIRREKWAAHKAKVDKWIEDYKGDVKRMNRAYRHITGSWEQSFLMSVSQQTDIPILRSVSAWEDSEFKYHMNYEPRGLKSLSDKQMAIFERIENHG